MDALSDLMRVLRFTAGVFLDVTLRAPCCFRAQISESDCGPGVNTSGGIVAFHFLLDGQLDLRLDKEAARECGPGDLILVPRNDAHWLGPDLTLPPLQAAREIRRAGQNEMPFLDYGDGPKVLNRFVCGFLATGVRGHPLLEALPPLLVTNVRGRPSAEWVESSFRYAAREHAARRPGSQDILGRLSELLFVEAVREHIERLPADATGWLAALRDTSLARAMSSLHARPAHPWTAEELAKEARLSRSAFAERFTSTVGLPPMSYLTRWRMLLASQRLRESADTIAQVAESAGYESESTFSRAFTREMGVAPGAWRKGDPAK